MNACATCGIQSSNEQVEQIAMKMAIDHEQREGRHLADVSHIDGWGFDLISWVSDDESATTVERLVEVKGHGHYKSDAGLRDSELRACRANPQAYWIYYVDDCHTSDPIVQPVHVRTWEKTGRLSVTRSSRVLGGRRPKPRKRRMRLGRSRIA